MQRFLLSVSLICFSLLTNAQQSIDVLHYKFELELSDKTDLIKGRAFITVKFTNPANRFWINLTSLTKEKTGMNSRKVQENGQQLTSIHTNDTLSIVLSKPAKKDEERTFEILYEGIPSDGLIISKTKYGDRTFFADNWPNRAHNWIPCIDDLTDKASFEFIVTAPSHYKVISNGVEIEKKELPDNKKLTHWKEDISLPTKVMVIGAADFAVKQYEDSPSNIPVTAWIFSRDSTLGFQEYALAPKILKFFSDYIAPYPYKKLANVQSETVYGGMENASAIFYSENSVAPYADNEALLAHEIVHQWFGDMATEKAFAHLWLSEGFATYLTHVYMESVYGTDKLVKRLQDDRLNIIDLLRSSEKQVVDSLTGYRNLLNANRYERGSWVLHMLRKQLSDSVFHPIIRSYYETYKGKNADTKDFQAIAEKISGKNLGYFFKQWLYTAAIPHLNIGWSYDDAQKILSVTVEQTQNTEPFIFPLDISIESGAGKSDTQTLAIDKKKQTFTFQSLKPLKIVADPLTSLLFEGKVKELK